MSMSSFGDEPAGRLSWRVLLIAFAGYSVLALLMTWPLVLHLTSALPSDAGDPLLSATILWWNAHVLPLTRRDRKSTRLNSSHVAISYAVFCLKKKKNKNT